MNKLALRICEGLKLGLSLLAQLFHTTAILPGMRGDATSGMVWVLHRKTVGHVVEVDLDIQMGRNLLNKIHEDLNSCLEESLEKHDSWCKNSIPQPGCMVNMAGILGVTDNKHKHHRQYSSHIHDVLR